MVWGAVVMSFIMNAFIIPSTQILHVKYCSLSPNEVETVSDNLFASVSISSSFVFLIFPLAPLLVPYHIKSTQ